MTEHEGAAETRGLQRLQTSVWRSSTSASRASFARFTATGRAKNGTRRALELSGGTPNTDFWGVATARRSCHDRGVNQESLERANAFLTAVAQRVEVGEALNASPTDIGRTIGIDQPLASARAIRALLARRRLELVDGSYRLLDARPVEAGERESVPRKPRTKRARPQPRAEQGERGSGRPTYSQVGREAVEKLIELGRENATLRTSLRSAREEAREAREAKDDAERRSQGLSGRVRDLEARAEMAESNLRTLLAAAKGAGRDAQVGQTEMEAILGVLKGGEDNGSAREDEPSGASGPSDGLSDPDLSSDVGR